MRILVVEDERKVASFISQGLAEEGHAVEVAADGAEALDLILAGPPYDLVVLDLMLPKRDGFGVLKSLRDRGVATPVLVLTARDSVADKVAGFDLGADDYLTKPFAFEEFLARVRALLRRGAERRMAPLRLDDLSLDPDPSDALVHRHSPGDPRRDRRALVLAPPLPPDPGSRHLPPGGGAGGQRHRLGGIGRRPWRGARVGSPGDPRAGILRQVLPAR